MLVPKEHIYKGGLSRCRNGALQAMFQTIGIVDKAGTGVDKILTGWLDQCLIPPSVDEEVNGLNRVTWTLPYVGLLPKSNEAELMRHFGALRYESLDAICRNILMIVHAQGSSAHKNIHQLLPFIHSVDLTRFLFGLVQSGYLHNEGRSSATRYTIANVKFIDVEHRSTFIHPGSTSINTDNSKDKIALSVDKQCSDGICKDRAPEDTQHNPGSIDVELHSTSIRKKLPTDLLRQLQRYRERTRNSPEETDSLILAICKGQWMSLPELAELLDRSVAYVRNKSLQSLVRHGKLKRKYDSPTHNNQAYMTAE